MPARPTIRQWMIRYNELVRFATSRGIRRGPDGALLHELTNLRVSNEAAAARVAALEAFLLGRGLQASANLPAQAVGYSREGLRFTIRDLPVAIPAVPPPVRSTSPTFGVEIECLFPVRIRMNDVARALSEAGIATEAEMYNHSRRSYWKVVTDGSLRANPNTTPYEIVSPVLTGQDGLDQIARVCGVLNTLGAVVNRSCGLHVHIGVSGDLDNTTFFRRLVGLYKSHMPQIERVLAPSRRQAGNIYCRDFRTHSDRDLDRCQTVAEVIHLVNGPNERHDRHYKLNLNAYFRHRTVEFRQHQGTLDPQKATMWTRFCLKLVAAAAKTTTLTTSDDLAGLLEQIEASPDERAYFLARQTHFETLEAQGDI